MQSYNQRIIEWLRKNRIRYTRTYDSLPGQPTVTIIRFTIYGPIIFNGSILRLQRHLQILRNNVSDTGRYSSGFRLQPSLNIEFELDMAYAEYLGK